MDEATKAAVAAERERIARLHDEAAARHEAAKDTAMAGYERCWAEVIRLGAGQ